MVANTRHLDNEEDLHDFCDACRDRITSWPATRWVHDDFTDMAEEEFPQIMNDIDSIEKEFYKTGKFVKDEAPDPGRIGAIWSQLRDFAKKRESVIWKSWADDSLPLVAKDGSPVGWGDDKLLRSTLLTHSSLIQHEYSEKPKPVDLDLICVQQGEEKVYFGSATAAELDAICSVPWLDPTMESSDFAHEVRFETLPEDMWQRVVDKQRVLEIRNFAEGPENYLFNPVLLHVNLDQHDCIKVMKPLNGRGKLRVNFDFLQKRPAGWTDYVPKPGDKDTRPFWIIDGQHRVRGFGSSERGSKLAIPFILMVTRGDDVPDTNLCARIFTEINTKAEELEKLHQMFMSYRFEMKMGHRNFSKSEDGRMYRRAYETALYMCSQPESPLINMIEFQKPAGQRRAHHLVVSAMNWVDIASKWFSGKNAIYHDLTSDSYNNEELFNFFKAFEQTCSAAEWIDGPRWDPGLSKNKPLLQFEGPFLSLLYLFPDLVNKIIGSKEPPRPIPIDVFAKELEPLINVDWNSQIILGSPLSGRTNNNVRHLKMWMFRAIENGVSYSREDILDDRQESVPGKGIISLPSKPVIEVDDLDWPTPSVPVLLSAEVPEHTLSQTWMVTFHAPGRAPREWDKKAVRAAMDKNELAIEWSDIPAGTEKISVITYMINGIGSQRSEELDLESN